MEKKETTTKISKKEDGMNAPMFTFLGESVESMVLPKEIFGSSVNMQLIAQAVRVFLANQREGSASTKTRGQVEGSTRKIYKQKGTGRARHGGIRAPIFVGGGVVFGPQPRDYTKQFPQSMKIKALISALSYEQKEKHIVVIDKTNDSKPKTAIAAKGFLKMGIPTPILIIIHSVQIPYIRAIRNIKGVRYILATQVTTYDVITHKSIGITKEAIEILTKRLS